MMDMSLWVSIPMIVFLILLSGLFSASETAFIAASKGSIQAKAKKGEKGALTVRTLRKHMEKVIGSLLLCNTLVNIMAASLTTSLFIRLFGEAGVAYATTVMTVVIVVYAEVLPKFYAVNRAESAVTFLAPILKLIYTLFGSITQVIEWVVHKNLKFFGITIDPGTHITSSEEELRGAIDLHRTEESHGIEERAMLHSILDLGEVNVSEIMVHRQNVLKIDANLPPEEIIDQVMHSPYTRIPLWKGDPDNIIGILHVKGLLRSLRAGKKDFDQDEIIKMAKKPWFIPETTSLIDQLRAFRQRKEHIAFVVDEYGAFMGVVTLEDIIEEIVGDINDEHDITLPGVWLAKNGDVFTTGTTTIRDLNRQFDWDLPDEEASTIAGLVLHESQKIPSMGQTFMIQSFRIKVLRRLRNQITLLRVTPPHPDSNPYYSE